MIRTIAVDDEPVALDVIRDHGRHVSFINLVATFSSAAEALTYLEREQVDLIFIDINMPDMSGLEFAGLVRQNSLVIFTTAYPEFAVQGFELAATDYLLKPINFNRFLQACQLAETRLPNLKTNAISKKPSLFVKDGYNWVKIKLDDVLYARAEDNYVSIVEPQRRTLTRTTLSGLLTKLPAGKFVQVHKSFIVALSKIEQVKGDYLVISGNKIPISTSFRDGFLQVLIKGT